MEIKEILNREDPKELRALFAFSIDTPLNLILLKFNLWARFFFPKYFESPDAPFHKDINLNNIKSYLGLIDSFVDIAFRGAGKDVKTKLFIPFVILNDTGHFRKYIKVLAEDGTNSKQIVTDVYNMLVNPRVTRIYPETFGKSVFKREETMSSFTTATGVKVLADTVGVDQRGAIQEEARPDWIWFNDFETRKTLRSAVETRSIWDNMEEARTGLQKGGACVYTCNYISELGNVHRLVTEKLSDRKVVLIVPVMDKDGNPTWERYSKGDIDQMRIDDDDFEGERMCKPSTSKDILFNREKLDAMPTLSPIRETAGFKIFRNFDKTHRVASGHDVAGGVGLDSSTSVFMDFDTVPAQVVATFKSNTIKPEDFGDEIYRQVHEFGDCLSAPEKNNHGHATIARAKQLGVNLYTTQPKDTKIGGEMPKEYGWHTNPFTKPKMIFAFVKAVDNGYVELNDENLKNECKAFSRNDLIDTEKDPRLTTRHFDLLIAAAICWQMKDHAFLPKPDTTAIDEYLEQMRADGMGIRSTR